MTLKTRIYKLLIEDQKYRNNDKELVWRVWSDLGFVLHDSKYLYDKIDKENFMKAPDNKSVTRCRRALQRTDLLTGKNLIQPNKTVKSNRVKLSKEKGQSFQQGKFNPETLTYEIF